MPAWIDRLPGQIAHLTGEVMLAIHHRLAIHAASGRNVDDFTCFINRFAMNDPYANCDGSTLPPILNVDDFTCFINAFAQGCP